MKSLIHLLSLKLTRFSERYVPDPLVIAVCLSFFTLSIAFIWGNQSVQYQPIPLLELWSGGLWKFSNFAMQMCLVLITGHALASSPTVRLSVNYLTRLVSSTSQAITLTALTAMTAGLINWGLGLIVGAFMVREVGLCCAQQKIKVHYPLLGAAGYTGLLVWHGGLSGTAPLKVTQLKDLQELNLNQGTIPLNETLLSSTNLILLAGLFVLVPLFLHFMSPSKQSSQEATNWLKHVGSSSFEEPETNAQQPTPSQRIEESRWLGLTLGFLILLCTLIQVLVQGVSHLDLDRINLFTLGLGLSLHPSLKSYAQAASEAVRSCSGIILQFPLYAGIMVVMSGAGLTTMLAQFMSEIATSESLASLTFLSAGLINLLVPSGGGQWAVQGPLVLSSAQALNAPLGKAVIAFAHGDAWTNLLQPFWALPLLAITQLKARELVGYTATLMLILSPWYLLVFWLF